MIVTESAQRHSVFSLFFSKTPSLPYFLSWFPYHLLAPEFLCPSTVKFVPHEYPATIKGSSWKQFIARWQCSIHEAQALNGYFDQEPCEWNDMDFSHLQVRQLLSLKQQTWGYLLEEWWSNSRPGKLMPGHTEAALMAFFPHTPYTEHWFCGLSPVVCNV